MARRENIQDRAERLNAGPRLRELRRAIEVLWTAGPPEEGQFSALAMLIVDAILDGDEASLHTAFEELQKTDANRRLESKEDFDSVEAAGRVLGLIDVSGWGIERSLSLSFMAEFEAGSHAHSFLKAIAEETGLANRDLVTALEVSDTEVSRVGRRLIAAGAATKRRLGRRNFWEITPRGLQTLEVLERGGISRFQRPHYQRA